MELDGERLDLFSASEQAEIARAAIDAIGGQLDAVKQAFAAANLETVREVAHRALGEALLIGARELSAEFASLQDAARAGEASAARAAFGRACAIWPATREAIATRYEATG